ncbi:hypothetical protein [Paraburkholderia sp. BL10I2N1]|uniref:hypothetical protein n=1 Tax=Paraburkholderia sp. BL10I2N1 TaxID=1938796 RepID=UPI0010608465|nr:hypothetical protein [Paraburkholderia sp. BL10I2N1]TDN70428.1 hypothetical protein B0G77_3902 [Paraburkholderia sp. BL10I2N1]
MSNAKQAKVALLSKDEALKLIKTNGNRIVSLRDDLQRIAVAAIGYANVHGDVTIAQAAVAVMTKGVTASKFIAYLCAHGQLEKDDKLGVRYIKRDDVTKDVAELVTTLADKKWFDHTAARVKKEEYDAKDELQRVITRLQKAAKKEGVVVHYETLLAQVALVVAKGVDVELPLPKAA